MTQTTSGIEQVFMPVYQRRKKVNPNDKNVNVSFTDKLGDAFEEYNVFHHKFLDWAEINGYDRKRVMQMSKEDLQKLVEECTAELDPYSRYLGRNPDKAQALEGLLQLPVALWPAPIRTEIEDLKTRVGSGLVVMTFGELSKVETFLLRFQVRQQHGTKL